MPPYVSVISLTVPDCPDKREYAFFSPEGKGEETEFPLHIQMQYVLAGFFEFYQLVEPALAGREHTGTDVSCAFRYPAVNTNFNSTAGFFRFDDKEYVAGMKSEFEYSLIPGCDILRTEEPLPRKSPLSVRKLSTSRPVIGYLVQNRSVLRY